MEFKVSKGTALFKELKKVHQNIVCVKEEARQLSLKVGATGYYAASFQLAGGISALVFDKKPDGYAKTYHSNNSFYPSKRLKVNKDLIKEIEALPVLPYSDINSLINYDDRKYRKPNGDGSFTTSLCPNIHFGSEYILIQFPTWCEYTTNLKDMQDISATEYIKLKNLIS